MLFGLGVSERNMLRSLFQNYGNMEFGPLITL